MQHKIRTLAFVQSARHLQMYLVQNTENNGVDKANSSHSHQTQQEEVGITVQFEVGGFWVKNRAHQLAFGCAETCGKRLL